MTLTEAMSVLMIALGWGVTGIIVMCVILPWMACAVVPITILYWMLMLHYRKSGADLQRLDAMARSPIQAMLAEGMKPADSSSFGSFFIILSSNIDSLPSLL